MSEALILPKPAPGSDAYHTCLQMCQMRLAALRRGVPAAVFFLDEAGIV